jgi:hypothetical protein
MQYRTIAGTYVKANIISDGRLQTKDKGAVAAA